MKLILGTMTFGPQVDLQDSKSMVDVFLSAGYKELDTAYVYNDGDTERILGEILSSDNRSAHVATKVNPRITGKLNGKAVYTQFNESLQRLKRESVDLLYFHFPDPDTPIESALKAFVDLYEQGKVKELGLSNFPAWMVVDIYHKCKENGWPTPSVYQGMYNGLSRKVENELFPALRELGMRLYAFNPLAGGLLSGKYNNFMENPSNGRFTLRPNYQDRYWKKSFFDALGMLTEKCKELDIPVAEAAYRWLAYHSQLDQSEGDGIIMGASKVNHLEQNIAANEKGELPDIIVDAFEEAWLEAKPDSPDYFRYIPSNSKKKV